MTKPEWDLNGVRIQALEHVLRCVMMQLREKGLLDMEQLAADLEPLGDEVPDFREREVRILGDAYTQQISRLVMPEPLDLDALP